MTPPRTYISSRGDSAAVAERSRVDTRRRWTGTPTTHGLPHLDGLVTFTVLVGIRQPFVLRSCTRSVILRLIGSGECGGEGEFLGALSERGGQFRDAGFGVVSAIFLGSPIV